MVANFFPNIEFIIAKNMYVSKGMALSKSMGMINNHGKL